MILFTPRMRVPNLQQSLISQFLLGAKGYGRLNPLVLQVPRGDREANHPKQVSEVGLKMMNYYDCHLADCKQLNRG